MRKLEAKREKLLKHVNNITLTMQKGSDVVDIPENVWWKAKTFDAELKCGPRFRIEDDYLQNGLKE